MKKKDKIAHGLTKLVVFPSGNPDKVIKFPFCGMYWYNSENELDYAPFEVVQDYCAEEADIYYEACELGLECFFAETEFGGCTKDGTKFYISERVRGYVKNKDTSKDSYEKASSFYCNICDAWLADAIEFYGLDKVRALINFLDSHQLSDFHTGNLGTRANGAPVLLDYSDYREA